MLNVILFGVYAIAPIMMISLFRNKTHKIYTACVTYGLFPIILIYDDLFESFNYYGVLLVTAFIMNFIFAPFIITKKKNFKSLLQYLKLALSFIVLLIVLIVISYIVVNIGFIEKDKLIYFVVLIKICICSMYSSIIISSIK